MRRELDEKKTDTMATINQIKDEVAAAVRYEREEAAIMRLFTQRQWRK
jgi:hypothetical protein